MRCINYWHWPVLILCFLLLCDWKFLLHIQTCWVLITGCDVGNDDAPLVDSEARTRPSEWGGAGTKAHRPWRYHTAMYLWQSSWWLGYTAGQWYENGDVVWSAMYCIYNYICSEERAIEIFGNVDFFVECRIDADEVPSSCEKSKYWGMFCFQTPVSYEIRCLSWTVIALEFRSLKNAVHAGLLLKKYKDADALNNNEHDSSLR